MREIRFRAWDKDAKEMLYAIPLTSTGKYSSYGLTVDYDPPKILTTIMQFTGLKDKHGTDIYEGDIVKYEPFWTKEVKWKGLEDGELGDIIGFGYDNCFEGGEVIGNIYQNPELVVAK